jgi:hypothetical protein
MKNIQTFQEFLNEYQTYAKYGSRETPGSVKADVILNVKDLIPVPAKDVDKEIVSVEDQSDDTKGIKFEIVLKSKDVIHAFKISAAPGHWEWHLNKKKMTVSQIIETLEDKMYTPFEKWLRHYEMRDPYYQMADDHRSYKSGQAQEEHVRKLYDKLSASDKKKADQHIEKTK